MSEDKTRIMILGGGFGGIYTAMYLEKALGREEKKRVEIILVNRENYTVFQHFLPQTISGTIKISNCIVPIRRLAPGTHLHTREIKEINLEKKWVCLAPGFRPKPLYLDYDHLVLAVGSQIDYSSVPGLREHAITFKYLKDALHLRNNLVRVLEEAEIETVATERNKLLTFVVVGGGLPGVECIAEMNDFLRIALRSYKMIRNEELRIILIQSDKRLLPEADERLAEYTRNIFEKRGVVICLNTRLKAITADSIVIQDETNEKEITLSTRTVVVTGPTVQHPVLKSLPCKLEQGRIKTTGFLNVPGMSNIWALGDCAAVPQIDGITSPPTAQHALRQAKTCAHNILAQMRGKKPRAFKFTGLGKLVSLGSGTAIADIFGFKYYGFFAFLLWRLVFLLEFPGIDGKFRILADWIMDIFLPKKITQEGLHQQDAVTQEHFEPGQIIIKRGDYAEKIYFIVRGEVEVHREGKGVAIIKQGEVFGEMALVSDRPRNSDIRARTALDVISVYRESFERLLHHMPGMRDTMESIIKLRLEEKSNGI